MSFKLLSEKEEKKKLTRTYKNDLTGSEIKTVLIFEDKKTKRKYWGFTDLYKIPYIRIVMSKHISDFYNVGISSKDLLNWCNQEKGLLRSDDPEKYEKLYSLIMEKERIVEFTADPIKQHLALCTVYIMEDEEPIDVFDEATAEKKLNAWASFPEMVAFFLSWHNGHIRRYMQGLDKILKIASKIPGMDQLV